MPSLNTNPDDGGGYFHFIPKMGLHDLPLQGDELESYCGFQFDTTGLDQPTFCDAINAGDVIFREERFDPDDLAQLVIRLKQDGYMCRECVREYFVEVGGIPGLFHHEWTEDLHRGNRVDPDGVLNFRAHERVLNEVDGVQVVVSGERVRVEGDCPYCSSPIGSVSYSVNTSGKLRVNLECQQCAWELSMDLGEWDVDVDADLSIDRNSFNL